MSRTTIEDVLECIICLDEVIEATLCPFCARCACRPCWDSIFLSSDLCPYCRADLSRSKLVKCGWFVDLRREVQECSHEKKRRIELEDDLVAIRCELDDERARLEEEREQRKQEDLVFNAERETFKLEQALLRKEQEENRQTAELLAVEGSIIEEKRNEVNKDMADLLDLQNSEQDEESHPSKIFKEVDFLLQQVGKKTKLIKCTSSDKSPALEKALNNMTATLNSLSMKLRECEGMLLREDDGPDAA